MNSHIYNLSEKRHQFSIDFSHPLLKLLRLITLYLIIASIPSMSGWAQSASWNYNTRTGTLGTTYSWIDCSAGSTIDMGDGDDERVSISWPFSFSFYDNNYTTANSLSVTDNGFIRLDGTATTTANIATSYNLTSTATNLGQIIATGVYDNKIGDDGGWCKYLVTGTAPNRILTIEYHNLEVDFNDGLYANVQVSFYETLNKVVLKLGADNITATGADMGLHSGVSGFFNKWQEVRSGTNNTWIEYTIPPPAIEVNATTGTTQASYYTLKAAFDKINDGTHKGVVSLKINGSTTESATAVLNASNSGAASYTSVNIHPTTTGLSINGNISGAPLIDFNGADNVTIDGRVNSTGSIKDLTIINTSTSNTARTSTLRLIESAQNNIIRYCNIKGSETRTSSGIIFFSTATTGTGNDGNTLDNNNITCAADANRPINAIYSAGTASRENSGNTISNNNIYDFLKHRTTSNGIHLSGSTTAWTISGNSFYETTTFISTNSVSYYAIAINNTSGINFAVSGNYIGGKTALCGGAAWTKTNALNSIFRGIYLNIGTTTPSNIQGNIIQNFSWANSGAASWTGIYINAGAANIGTASGNTIGAPNGTNSITLTSGANGAYLYGIYINGTGVVNCQNNILGSITTNNTSANATYFYGIYKTATAGTITISNNTIGSTTTVNSINANSASTGNPQVVYGIYNTGTGAIFINNNTIANLKNSTTNTNTGTSGRITGIMSTSGTNTIVNNIICDLSIANANTVATQNASICGIALSGTTLKTITGNTIYNLSNTYASFAGNVIGLYFTGNIGANVVSANMIRSLSVNGATSTTTSIYGIKIASGATTYANNIISLGGNTKTTVYGIYETGTAGNNNNLYFNTVYIGGTPASGTTNKSYALYSAVTTNTRNFRNNIFMNARSTTGGASLHYAAYFNYPVSTSLTLGYNDYYTSGTGGVSGYYGAANKTTLPIVTGLDGSSLAINPGFANAGGSTSPDYYTSAALPGITGTGITTDYEGSIRGATPKMGALEYNVYIWQGNLSTDFATAGNWVGNSVPTDGSDISFAMNPTNHCVLDQNRSLKNIVNAQASKQFVLNGKQLTITGNLTFTNGAQIDASSASSVVVFAGISAQAIPSGAFVSNTLDALTVNNTNGLTLNGDITVTKTLTLTSGIFSIGANTLTLNGAITKTAGTLTGGSTTKMIFGGSGSSTTLPTISLNNLTLNRANGINLGGAVDIAGTLTLSAGTLTVGANTLTLSGSTPIRTSGNVDVSNASATLVFANTTAITLPTSFFTGNLNNLTISGTGGITSGNDLTLNGVLNLQSANPSATKGTLNMWDGSASKTLTMGANATTTGTGDVTGIVKRSSLVAGTVYSFGNQYTTMTFSSGGTMPADIRIKIDIGSAPSWKPSAVQRTYDIIRTGGSGTTVAISFHYLDTELQSNTESNLVTWDFLSAVPLVAEHGKANQNLTQNWVSISNRNISYLPTSFNQQPWGLANSESAGFIWQGSFNSDWNDVNNWPGGTIPNSTSDVIIPDASTTLYDPILPTSPAASVNTITIQSDGILNGGTATTLTVEGSDGAWINYGTFNPGTSTVNFRNANATLADTTVFYNLNIATGAGLTPESGADVRILGALTIEGTGVLHAASHPNTIEYSGTDQTVTNPNGTTPGYHNLILSGSGTKTLPSTALLIAGDFSISGTTTVTAGAAMTIGGNVGINVASAFITGNYNHTIRGDLNINGTFTATAGNTVTMNGSLAQSISGAASITFQNLTINNSLGVNLSTDININNTLTLSNGNLSVEETTLGINGTISKTSGFLSVNPLSSLTFGGTGSITLANNLFTAQPSINNLSINRSGEVSLGNQGPIINGLLDLQSGNLTIGANTLTIAGSTLTRTNGMIDASHTGATFTLTNSDPLTLPASVFAGNVVNNLTVNGVGGVTAISDFTVNGILSLQSDNPSDTQGCLDMWDGSVMKTLTMGANATTIGVGDVTGIVTRTTINPGISYSFGNQFTTLYFSNVGTLPTSISAKIQIGAEPSWKTGAINRDIEFIKTGGVDAKANISIHYLDTELNGNDESKLVLWLMNDGENGRSAYNIIDKWVSLFNVDITLFSSSWNNFNNITLDEFTSTTILTWDGSKDNSWTDKHNWTPQNAPTTSDNIIIPDASATSYSPTLPASTEIKTLTIEAGGILNSATSSQLTINGGNGAWSNNGAFNASTGTVIFKNAAATLSGETDFYNITINSGANLLMTNGSIMRIAGTITNSGVWNAMIGGTTTVEYNGSDQNIINPNGTTAGYYNLILSNSGTKTAGAAISTNGSFIIEADAIFNAGSYNHIINGDFSNNSTFTGAGSTVSFNGSLAQMMNSTSATTFNNLTINNATGVMLASDALTTVSGTLAINSGKKLTVLPGKRLTVTGVLTNTDASGLVLQSDASGTASLTHNTDNVSATAYCYISGSAEDWHFLASPISNQSINNDWAPPGSYGNGTGYDLYAWYEPSSCWIYQLNTTSTVNWNTIHPGSSFIPGRGYLYSIQSATNPTKTFAGILNNGTYTIPLTNNSTIPAYAGFNLIGNPYPSSIDWKAASGWTRSDLADSISTGNYNIWIWNPASNNYGVYNTAFSSDQGTNNVSRFIPPMQSFFVKGARTGNLIMTNAVRVHDSTTRWKSAISDDSNPTTTLSLTVKSEAGLGTDEVLIFIGNSPNETGASKLFSPVSTAPSLYLSKAEKNLSVCQLTTQDSVAVPVLFKAGKDGKYTFSSNFDWTQFETLLLEDRQTNAIHNLKSSPGFQFTAKQSDDPLRFRLHFTNYELNQSDILPAQIYCFDHQLTIDLTYVTADTDIRIYDSMGRMILKQKIKGSVKHNFTLPANQQILTVCLSNNNGELIRKIANK